MKTRQIVSRLVALFLLAIAFSAATIPVLAQSNPVTDAARELFPEHEKNIVGAFVSMPEAKYAFKPTPELMPFSELARHIAGANFYHCRVLSGVRPTVNFPKPNAPKEELVRVLRESFDFCRPVIAGLKDSQLGESVPTVKDKTSTRALVLILFLSGMDHHYGQAASYLRLNSVLPPTAVNEEAHH